MNQKHFTSIRLDPELVSTLDNMANIIKTSRNGIIVTLIELGMPILKSKIQAFEQATEEQP